jgi:hypothetical protein
MRANGRTLELNPQNVHPEEIAQFLNSALSFSLAFAKRTLALPSASLPTKESGSVKGVLGSRKVGMDITRRIAVQVFSRAAHHRPETKNLPLFEFFTVCACRSFNEAS